MNKRLLNLFLALVMIVCVLPFAASAKTISCEHDYSKLLKVYTEPTCSKPGSAQYQCTKCNMQKTVTLDPHTPVEVKVPAVAATCTSTGLTEGTKCSLCNEPIVAQTETPKISHKHDKFLGYLNDVKPSCEKGATEVWLCTICNVQQKHIDVPATGHDYSKLLKIYEEPTCSKPGSAQYQCTKCIKQKTVTLDPHTPVEVKVPAVAATCTKTGLTEGTKCSLCNEPIVAQTETPKIPHKHDKFLGYLNDVEPSCEKGATEVWICTICNVQQKHIDVPATGHDYSKLLKVYEEPTCSKPGRAQYKCTKCIKQKTVTLDPHTPVEVKVPAVAATCTKTGLTEGTKCSLCNEPIVAQTETPKIPHNHTIFWGYEEFKEPTCTEGAVEVWICEICNKNQKHIEVPKLGHDEEVLDEYRAPSCEKVGCSKFRCKRCKVETIRETAALGHSWEEVPGVDATCKEPGYTAHKQCTVCHAVEGKTELALKDHEKKDKSYPATCTVDGLDHVVCVNCDEVLLNEVKTAPGHKYKDGKCVVCGAYEACQHPEEKLTKDYQEATCAQGGHSIVTCECGAVVHEEKWNALDHEKKDKSYPATCTEDGLEHVVCTKCNQVLINEVRPATGHNYQDGACTVCGAADPNYTPETTPQPEKPENTACQHTNTSTYTYPATCTTVGYVLVTCVDCETVVSNETLPATGHDEKTTIQPATCTKNGVKTVTCRNCSKINHEVLPATGHQYDNGLCIDCGKADPNKYTSDLQGVHIVG